MSALPTDQGFQEIDAAARGWARSFPIDEVKRHIAELERERAAIDAEIEGLRRRVTLWSALRGLAADAAAEDQPNHEVPVPSKRDALLMLLAEAQGKSLRLVEMREEMIARGWLPRTAQAIHALEVAATTLAQRGEAERVKKGTYRLPPPLRLRLLDGT